MRRELSTSILLCLVVPAIAEAQQTIHVPADAPSIQQAIVEASSGSIIDISPGTYNENIDFLGKALTVEGAGQRDQVVIDGGFRGPVVRFTNGEGRNSILQNLTVQHGGPADIADRFTLTAGGVFIDNAAPTLNNIVVTDNIECGIGSFNSSPLIENSVVQNTTHNSQAYGCPVHNVGSEFFSQSQGTGIFIYGHAASGLSTAITGSTIAVNTATVLNSGGIAAIDAGTLQIKNNFMHTNTTQGSGGGIGIFGDSAGLITQNLIVSNTVDATSVINPAVTDAGAGINLEVASSSPLYLTNNTIADNKDVGGPLAGTQLYIGQRGIVSLSNNLLIGSDANLPLQCEPSSEGVPPPILTFNHNDVYAPGAANSYGGICAGFAAKNGDISADPLFTGPGNFELSLPSPAVDTGDNTAVGLGSTDFGGEPRIQNATGTPQAIVDLGAYEHAGLPAVPLSPSFDLAVSPTAVDLSQASSATVSITLTPNSTFQSQIVLACADLPAAISCTFSPATVALGNGLPQTASLTISRTQAASIPGRDLGTALDEELQLALCGCVIAFTPRRKHWRSLLLATLATSAAVFLVACGVHVHRAAQQASVSVTATSATGLQKTAHLSLTLPHL